MSKTQRAIGIGTLALVVALGAGWTFEKAYGNRGAQDRRGVSGSATTVAPMSTAPELVPAAAPDQEYDRSDLLLSQG